MAQDYCTREGAERLKREIERYWAERGHHVTVRLVEGSFLASMRSKREDIRSDMRNGLPRSTNAARPATRRSGGGE